MPIAEIGKGLGVITPETPRTGPSMGQAMTSGHEQGAAAVCVGNTQDRHAKVIRIIHISDTHLKHGSFSPSFIPKGDVLVHSGDFVNMPGMNAATPEFAHRDLEEISQFFNEQPHRHKIFVAGNHEFAIGRLTAEEIQRGLPGIHYLQDRSVVLDGIKFHGSPWTRSPYMGFSCHNLIRKWAIIPRDTDVVITHMPPYGVLDKGRAWGEGRPCPTCSQEDRAVTHEGRGHWGCPDLLHQIVTRVKPKAHLFGHVHEENGTQREFGVLFSNGTLAEATARPTVIDFYLHSTDSKEQSHKSPREEKETRDLSLLTAEESRGEYE